LISSLCVPWEQTQRDIRIEIIYWRINREPVCSIAHGLCRENLSRAPGAATRSNFQVELTLRIDKRILVHKELGAGVNLNWRSLDKPLQTTKHECAVLLDPWDGRNTQGVALNDERDRRGRLNAGES
jgi:hypothetical protein